MTAGRPAGEEGLKTPTDTERNWDEMALAYEFFSSAGDSYSGQVEWPCLRGLLPELSGARALDLGCGTGRFTFLLEELGASAPLGVDLSERMLALARSKAAERGSRARFQKGDVQDLSGLPDGGFDLVFSSTTLHYLPALGPVFREIRRVLRPGGVCLLSLMHPVYTAQYPLDHRGAFPTEEEWQVRYLDRSLRAYIQPWIEYNDKIADFLTASYHHTLGDYLNAALAAGLLLRRVEEPAPPEAWRTDCPGRYNAFIETPSYLVLKLEKPFRNG